MLFLLFIFEDMLVNYYYFNEKCGDITMISKYVELKILFYHVFILGFYC